MGEEVLKACPLCSSPEPYSTFVTGMVSRWRVGCEACDLKVEVGVKPFDRESEQRGKAEAERRWNTRPTPSEDAVERVVEAAREALGGLSPLEEGRLRAALSAMQARTPDDGDDDA